MSRLQCNAWLSTNKTALKPIYAVPRWPGLVHRTKTLDPARYIKAQNIADRIGEALFASGPSRDRVSNRDLRAGFGPLAAPATRRFLEPSGGMGGEKWQAR